MQHPLEVGANRQLADRGRSRLPDWPAHRPLDTLLPRSREIAEEAATCPHSQRLGSQRRAYSCCNPRPCDPGDPFVPLDELPPWVQTPLARPRAARNLGYRFASRPLDERVCAVVGGAGS